MERFFVMLIWALASSSAKGAVQTALVPLNEADS
jgi:hypothetical protein